MKSLLLLGLFLLMFLVNMDAQDGAPDPTFGGGDGFIFHSIFQDKASQGYGIAVQQDQKIIVAGTSLGPDGHGHGFVSRYNEDGSLDNSFNGSGIIVLEVPGINAHCPAVKLQPDGKIVLCTQSSDSTRRYVSVLRFSANGVPDNSFGGDGQATTIIGSKYMGIGTMALQTDGSIVIGGYAGGTDSDSFLVVRYLSNGELDQSFGGDGIVITGVGEDYTDINAVTVQSDGKIIAAGYATFNGTQDMAIIRLNTNGTLDNTFSGDGITHVTISEGDDQVNSCLVQPDSKIVLAGEGQNSATGRSSFAAVRLNPDGTPDNSFHGDGIALIYISDYHDKAYSMIRQPDGKYILAGNYYAGAPSLGFMLAVARITEDGVLDHTFDDDGVYKYPLLTGIQSTINKATLQPDGKVISTGNYRVGTLNQVMLFRTLTGLTTATVEIDQVVSDLWLYPNPVSEEIVINYSLEKNENLRITLCDDMGRTVNQLLEKVERNAGDHEEHLKLNRSLVPGCYFVKIESAAGAKAIPIVIK